MKTADLFDQIEENSISVEKELAVSADRIYLKTLDRIKRSDNEHLPRRKLGVIMLAAILVVFLLATTAFAGAAFEKYDSPIELLEIVFGNSTFQNISGGNDVQVLPEKEVPITVPLGERVELEDHAALEVSSQLRHVNSSVSVGDNILTVIAYQYDPVTKGGFLYYSMESNAGITGYSVLPTGEILWKNDETVYSTVFGKSYWIEEETADNKISAIFYFQIFDSSAGGFRFGLSDAEEASVYLDISTITEFQAKQSADGDIFVSPVGIKLCLDDMYFLGVVDTDGTYIPPRDDNRIQSLEIEYGDGSTFVVKSTSESGAIDNSVLGYSAGFQPTVVSYMFNRLICVEDVRAVRINGVRYRMYDSVEVPDGAGAGIHIADSAHFAEASFSAEQERLGEFGAINEGTLWHKIIDARVVTDISKLDPGCFREDSYVSVYTRKGERILYSNPEFICDGGALPGGVRLLLLDVEVTSDEARNWTVDTWPRGLYEDPFVFRIDGLYVLREKVGKEGLFGYHMDYFSGAGEIEEHAFAFRILPGETRTFSVGFLIGGDSDGSILPAEAFNVRVPYGGYDEKGEWIRKEQVYSVESKK